MMARSLADEPPRAATWLVSLFTLAGETESILGDLLEEYSSLVSHAGSAFARRWYWRQTLKTIVHLIPAAFTVAPWSTAAGVVGGMTAKKLVGPVSPMIFWVLERYQVYQHHFAIYMFFASTGLDLAFLITFLCQGCIVAWIAKGTEMAATMVLSLIQVAMLLFIFPYLLVKTGHPNFGGSPIWSLADALAIVVGGAIVRVSRSKTTTVTL